MAKKEPRVSALQRALEAAIGAMRTVGLESDPAREKYPNLWEWLTMVGQDTDYVMSPAVISVQLGPEGALVTITHRDMQVSCGAACSNLDDAFLSLEAQLACTNPPIRSWGKGEPVLRKRRKS